MYFRNNKTEVNKKVEIKVKRKKVAIKVKNVLELTSDFSKINLF